MAMIVAACGNKDGDCDASGIFEATKVMISAGETGELLRITVRS